MIDEIERAYFIMRAREEREREAACKDPSVASIHRAMAQEYEKKAQELGGLAA